jgi:hypothetical protein
MFGVSSSSWFVIFRSGYRGGFIFTWFLLLFPKLGRSRTRTPMRDVFAVNVKIIVGSNSLGVGRHLAAAYGMEPFDPRAASFAGAHWWNPFNATTISATTAPST